MIRLQSLAMFEDNACGRKWTMDSDKINKKSMDSNSGCKSSTLDDAAELPPNFVNSDYHSDMHLELKLEALSNSELVSGELEELDSDHQHPKVVSQFNELRTKQLIIIVLSTIAIAFINNLINQQSEITSQVLGFAALIFVGCFMLVNRGKVVLGGLILLWTLYITLTILLVSNDGLRDPVTIGYTGILIFAAMLGNRRQFVLLTLTMGLSFLFVGYANQAGWLDYSSTPFGWGIVIDLFIIYTVISYSAWTLANDLRFALSSLEVENLRVNKSKQVYQRIAHYDHLTGLPNRIIAVDRFNQAIFHSLRNKVSVAVLFLDLDNFKTVNDSLGHAVGDKLLQEIARRLENSVRDFDTVCRLGGDEFLILLDGIQDNAVVSRISNNILLNVAKPIDIEHHKMTTTCSIGIAVSSVDGEDFDVLRKKADTAMYKAKESGLNAFMFFDKHMNKDRLTHIDRVNSLRNAIANQEFVLYYQPKVDLSSGKIFSAEALIRWKQEGRTMGMPDEFIPIAESTGLIIEIGEWVLYEACRQCKEFQQRGLSDFSIAVNLSSIQFRRGNLAELVKSALTAAGLSPSYLELEVTESLLIEDGDIIRKQIVELQKCGVTFSIDDFGTGYSSLAQLRKMPVSVLKIDRSFIRHMVTDPSDAVIVSATINMAHELGIKVVAEGVEDKLTLEQLKKLNCDIVQGYFFAKPMVVDKFDLWLKARTNTN